MSDFPAPPDRWRLVRFYRLAVDSGIGTQWFPSEPATESGDAVDARLFVSCSRYAGPQLRLRTKQPGHLFPLNFGPFDIPLASRALGAKLALIAPDDIEVIPLQTDFDQQLLIVNVLTCRDCIDPARTVGTRWTESDGRPDKVGEYRMIVKLVIDPALAGGAKVMRLQGWRTPLLVSEDLLGALDPQDLEGLVSIPVTEENA